MNQRTRFILILLIATVPVVFYLFDPKVFFVVSVPGIKAFFTALVIVLSALGYGCLLLGRGGGSGKFGNGAFLMIATGLGIESFLMMLTGFAGFVTLATGLLIIAGGLAPSINYLKKHVFRLHTPDVFELDILAIATVCIVAVAVLLTLPVGLMPPVFYDGLVYHLALPKYYLLEGRIIHAPYNFFSFFPQSVEMLYLIALLAGGEAAPKALTWLLAVICFWGVHDTASTLGGSRRAGLWAMLIMFGMPWTVICSQIVYIELAVAIFVVASFLMTLRVEEWDGGETVAAAVVIGAGAGAKYTTAPLAALIGIYAVVRLGALRHWSKIAVYLLVGSTVAAPWYIRNLIVASNPVAPFYFGSKFWSAQQVSRYAQMQSGYGLGLAPIYKKILAPIAAFVRPHLFPQSIGLGIAPLFAALFIPFATTARRRVLFPVLIFLWGALIWTFTSQQPRFLVVPAVFLVASGAAALAEFEKHGLIRKTAGFVLAAAALVGLCEGIGAVGIAFKPWEGIILREKTDEYIARRVHSYPAMQKVAELPAGREVTLVVGETRTYYMKRPFIPITAWDVNPLVEAVAECDDTACVKKKLKNMGIGIIIRDTAEERRLVKQYDFLGPVPESRRRLYYKFLDELTVYAKRKNSIIYFL